MYIDTIKFTPFNRKTEVDIIWSKIVNNYLSI